MKSALWDIYVGVGSSAHGYREKERERNRESSVLNHINLGIRLKLEQNFKELAIKGERLEPPYSVTQSNQCGLIMYDRIQCMTGYNDVITGGGRMKERTREAKERVGDETGSFREKIR